MTLPRLAEIRKTVVGIIGLIAMAASSGLVHGTAQTIAQAIVAGATAFGIYQVPNASPAPTVATGSEHAA